MLLSDRNSYTSTAQRAPDCEMVVVHDDDLEQVLPVNNGTVSKCRIS